MLYCYQMCIRDRFKDVLKFVSARNIPSGNPNCAGSKDSMGRVSVKLGTIEHCALKLNFSYSDCKVIVVLWWDRQDALLMPEIGNSFFTSFNLSF